MNYVNAALFFVISLVAVSCSPSETGNSDASTSSSLSPHEDLNSARIQWAAALKNNDIGRANAIQDELIKRGDRGAITERASRSYSIAMRYTTNADERVRLLNEAVDLLEKIDYDSQPESARIADAEALARYRSAIDKHE